MYEQTLKNQAENLAQEKQLQLHNDYAEKERYSSIFFLSSADVLLETRSSPTTLVAIFRSLGSCALRQKCQFSSLNDGFKNELY